MNKVFRTKPKQLAISVASAAIVMSGFNSVSVLAQDDDEQVAEEMIISAERRDTTASTTAISMEVLTGEDLAENQIRGLEDLQKGVPNLQFNTNGYGWAQANIRGVGNPSGGGAAEQVGVPILFDGATQGEEIGLGGAMFDVGDVQVLRGPQGTFIGQSAAGGAILVNSARPNFDGVNGYIEGQAGSYGHEKVAGAINLPISDTLSARLAFSSATQGSWYSNQASGRAVASEDFTPGGTEDRSFRLGLLWQPNDQFSGYMKLESTKFISGGRTDSPSPRTYTGYWDDDNDEGFANPGSPFFPNPTYIPGYVPTPRLAVTSHSRYAQGPIPGTGTPDAFDPTIIYNGVQGPGGELYAPTEPFQLAHPDYVRSEQNNLRFTLDLSYEMDNGIAVNSTTSYFDVGAFNAFGGNSRVYAPLFYSFLGPEIYTAAQEFTIVSPDGQKLDWLAGISYSKRHTEVDGGAQGGGQTCGWEYDNSWSPCSTVPTVPTTYFYTISDTEIEQQAFFFQLDYQLTDEIELTFGGRYNRDDNSGISDFIFTDADPFSFSYIDPSVGFLCPGYGGSLGLYCPNEDPRTFTSTNFFYSQTEFKGETPTYKVGVNWEPSDNQFFYVFYARGYKAGQPTQIDPATGLTSPGTTPVVEEIVDDFEFGWKGTLLDGALYAELGYFFQDYKDMQLGGSYVTSANSSGGGTGNIGDSEIEGIEGSLRTNIGNLNINASFGYTRSELNGISTYETRAFSLPDNSDNLPIGDSSKGCISTVDLLCYDFSPYQLELNGKENLNSPELSYNLSFDYPISLNNGSTVIPRLSFSHADTSYTNINQIPGENYYTRDERDLINFSVTYDINDWSIQGYVNNLTDELYAEEVGDNIIYGQPRMMGIRARMTF